MIPVQVSQTHPGMKCRAQNAPRDACGLTVQVTVMSNVSVRTESAHPVHQITVARVEKKELNVLRTANGPLTVLRPGPDAQYRERAVHALRLDMVIVKTETVRVMRARLKITVRRIVVSLFVEMGTVMARRIVLLVHRTVMCAEIPPRAGSTR